jgi:hypothetical protein
MLKSGNEGSGCNGDGKRFVARADEKLTAFLELESGKEGASGSAWSDDTCPKSLFEEIMRLRDQP